MSHGEVMADKLLDELRITDPRDLQLLPKIVWARNALFREAPLTGSEARLNYNPTGRSIITISDKIENPERKRFSIAHELGHLELHAASRQLHLCSKEDINYRKKKGSSPIEIEANDFAAHFLLPTRFLSKHFSNKEPSLGLIATIASEFKASLTATALRFLDFTEEPIAVVSSQNGVIEWFQSTQDFLDSGLFVDVHARVRKPSGAALFFLDKQSPPMTWRTVPALTWLKEGRVGDTARIKEWSIAMPNYSTVLTLLWIPGEFFDGDADDDFMYL